MPPRDRCLITAQWFTGLRISETLSLAVGSVLRSGEIVSKIAVAPRNKKKSARPIIHAAFAAAAIENDRRLGTHTLRKTWARKVYKNSGNDLVIFKAALNHSDVSVPQKYLEADEDDVMAAIAKCDFTSKKPALCIVAEAAPRAAAAVA